MLWDSALYHFLKKMLEGGHPKTSEKKPCSCKSIYPKLQARRIGMYVKQVNVEEGYGSCIGAVVYSLVYKPSNLIIFLS